MDRKSMILFIFVMVFISSSSFTQDYEILLKNDGTILVIGDKVNVRQSATTKSTVVYQLRIAERVKILKRSGVEFNSNSIIGEWVYIDTSYRKPGGGGTIKGWVVDYFLADYSKFKKIDYSIDCHLTGTIGDWGMDYQFLEKGKYKRKAKDNTGKEIYKLGTIYQYKDVLLFRDDDGCTFDYFYFEKDNKLCHYYRDKDGNSLCFTCKKK